MAVEFHYYFFYCESMYTNFRGMSTWPLHCVPCVLFCSVPSDALCLAV